MTQKQKLNRIIVNAKPDSTVILTYLDREEIFLDPDYQRQSDVWSLEKKQLLIDSIINRFDIPKFYFHEYEKPKTIDGNTYKYALIDGKQRLSAIWSFIDNEFALGDYEYLQDPKIDLKGLTYSELTSQHPRLAATFDGTPLSIMSVRTADTELIEEMFTRLNEAVPLNAPEKRGAFGGPLPPVINDLIKIKFFTDNLPFTNKRYRHKDLACKFLYLSERDEPEDTKKIQLDLFVKRYKQDKFTKEAEALKAKAKKILNAMSSVFVINDPLLKNVGMVVVYYLLFSNGMKIGHLNTITRKKLVDFDDQRKENREVAETDSEKADYTLLRLDELNSSVNDKYAIKYKYDVFTAYALPKLRKKDSLFLP